MITKQQVADLQPGDVVRVGIEGPVVREGGELRLSDGRLLKWPDGSVASWVADYDLTVVARAPRPLYVNHPRTEPVDHDVVRDGDDVIRHCDASGFGGKPTWWAFEAIAGCKWTHTTFPPQPLTLLVDGETGQVVP